MNNMPKGQKRAAVILCLIILLVILVMLAFMNLSAFFITLVLLILGLCLLRVKKPEFFSIFAKEKPVEAQEVSDEKKRDVFSAHIILLYQGGMTTQQISVDREEFSIGRSQSCNFVLSGNTDISRVHAFIRYDAERDVSTITDNNSSHGTKVNGDSLSPGVSRTLHNGDLIQIEDRVMTVQRKNF